MAERHREINNQINNNQNSIFLNVAISGLGLISMLVFYCNFDYSMGRENFPVMLIPTATLFLTSIDKLFCVNNNDKLDKVIRILSGFIIGVTTFLLLVMILDYLGVILVSNLDATDLTSPMVIVLKGSFQKTSDFLIKHNIYFYLKSYVSIYIFAFVSQIISNVLHHISKKRKSNSDNELSTKKD